MSKTVRNRAYWCDTCQVPLLGKSCCLCKNNGRDLCAASLAPVFRPEIQYLKKRIPPALRVYLKEGEIWVSTKNYTYYYQGTPIFKLSASNDKATVLKQIQELKPPFRSQKACRLALRKANKKYIENLQYEAEDFIRQTVAAYKEKTLMISFSGGKDSTVTSHLVMNGLGHSDVLHIFADTTIEFPDTYSYLQEFQRQHPLTPFLQSRSQLDFFQTAESIGPPSRILRWCCTTHKTNPIAKLINSMSPEQGVLTFDGIRRAESTRRSKYRRISNKHKITREILASPIINWTDLDVWLYLLYHNLLFNQAYRKGFRRVGCLYCPFNSSWSHAMIKARYSKQGEMWHSFLLKQARRMRHQNPELFADWGWRSRAGGRGLDYYKSSIESTPCKLSDNAVMYQLLSGDILLVRHFLRPLGPQSVVSSNEFSESFLIHDYRSHIIIASVEVSYTDQAIRINYLIKKYKRVFKQRIEKQLKKIQACIFCGACGAKCKTKALNSSGLFYVDVNKCVSCLSCVKHRCPIVDSLTKKGKQ